MATLKSIKNKYLSTADGEVLGVDQNKDNVSLLAFKLAAADSIAKFDMRDGFFDDFQDATGVDASASTDETRNASDYYSGSTPGSNLSAYTSSSGNWTCPAGVNTVEVLVVAGGGGAGGYGGGGGAGGVVHHIGKSVTPGSTYAYSIGSGGTGCAYNSSSSTNGGNSTFDTITATGGGRAIGNGAGQSGGSGGGGNGGYGSPGGNATQTDSGGGTGYGNDGGNGFSANYHGGGGGGAGAAGQDAVSGDGGDGGIGKYFANFDSYGTDSSNAKPTSDGSGSGKGYFGGGGGGMSHTSGSVGVGGAGGGADGRTGTSTGYDGQANTGGGGGGARNAVGGQGGSGIVLIRDIEPNNMTLVSNSTTASSTPTTGDIVLTYTNGAGTATVNTDLKAWISRDNGTTYTQGTLVSEGTTGGDTILAARRVDISGQPSGTSMRYKITTHNQSVAKETRLQAASLAWA